MALRGRLRCLVNAGAERLRCAIASCSQTADGRSVSIRPDSPREQRSARTATTHVASPRRGDLRAGKRIRRREELDLLAGGLELGLVETELAGQLEALVLQVGDAAIALGELCRRLLACVGEPTSERLGEPERRSDLVGDPGPVLVHPVGDWVNVLADAASVLVGPSRDRVQHVPPFRPLGRSTRTADSSPR
jgi:hypothetical protein